METTHNYISKVTIMIAYVKVNEKTSLPHPLVYPVCVLLYLREARHNIVLVDLSHRSVVTRIPTSLLQ